MVVTGQMHKLRYLADDSLIPEIIKHSKAILKQADLTFWSQGQIRMVQFERKQIVDLDWLLEY
jgi:hypothetical protein